MTDPITPPPELVQQWEEQFLERPTINGCFIQSYIATKAAQWGADQELDACIAWLVRNYNYPEAGNPLRAARRPKPPSLKEEALKALERMQDQYPHLGNTKTIRRALEALDD
jgi:hypothetical protein